MAATFNESQKIDYLWKKVGYGVTKTAEVTAKEAFNESIASPLLYRGDLVWMESDQITGTPPSSTNSIIQVYKDGSGSFSPSVECTEDLTAPDNQTWKTNLTNWVPTQFGDNYLIQVYVANSGVTNPQTSGTKLFQAGSGNDDTWFFDYQSGVLNFNGANIPSQITGGITGKSVYVVGYRYVGLLGVTNLPSNTSIGNLNFTGSTITSTNLNGNIVLTPNGTGIVEVSSDLTSNANITAAYFIGNGSQLTGIATGSALNVSESDITGGNVTNSVSNVSTLKFDKTTGFSVSDLGDGNAVISLGSTFKTWEVTGQPSLVAVGEDTVEFIAGNGIAITTSNTSVPKSITFSANNIANANYANSANSANYAGTVTTNAQPNITSTGTLTGLDVSGHLVANTFQMGYGIYAFYSTSVFFATTSSTSPDQVLWNYPAADLSAIDFTIIATDNTGSTRQSCKISAAILGTTVAFNEYGGLFINGGVGSFSVTYNAGGPTPMLELVVTPDSSNLTEYNMLISKYLV